jgi:hypothetical protein
LGLSVGGGTTLRRGGGGTALAKGGRGGFPRGGGATEGGGGGEDRWKEGDTAVMRKETRRTTTGSPRMRRTGRALPLRHDGSRVSGVLLSHAKRIDMTYEGVTPLYMAQIRAMLAARWVMWCHIDISHVKSYGVTKSRRLLWCDWRPNRLPLRVHQSRHSSRLYSVTLEDFV